MKLIKKVKRCPKCGGTDLGGDIHTPDIDKCYDCGFIMEGWND